MQQSSHTQTGSCSTQRSRNFIMQNLHCKGCEEKASSKFQIVGNANFNRKLHIEFYLKKIT